MNPQQLSPAETGIRYAEAGGQTTEEIDQQDWWRDDLSFYDSEVGPPRVDGDEADPDDCPPTERATGDEENEDNA